MICKQIIATYEGIMFDKWLEYVFGKEDRYMLHVTWAES